MISFVEGVLAEALPTQVVVDVQGVGYQLLIPLSSYEALPPPGGKVRLLTHLHVREDAMVLYGFGSAEERDLFRLLIQHVTGIGPRMALAVLSGMAVGQFKAAVVSGDTAAISKISGVGKKTAERVVLELKDKVGVAAAWEAATTTPQDAAAAHLDDAVLALMSLGYRQVEAQRAVRAVSTRLPAEASSEEVLREALKGLA